MDIPSDVFRPAVIAAYDRAIDRLFERAVVVFCLSFVLGGGVVLVATEDEATWACSYGSGCEQP